jgi:filamentous hemagglutinin
LTANIDGAGFSISNVGTVAATTLISATGNIQGGNIRTAGLITATGAITGAAITGSSLTVSTGNITAGNLLLSGAIVDSAQLDIQTSAANANIAMTPNGTGIVTVSTQLSAVGNVSGGNIRTAGLITATGNIQAGNILTAGLISATSTITSAANVIGGNISTAGLITATGNVQAGNIRTAGLITATGAITGGALTGTSLTVSTGNITTGNIVNANANGVGNIGSATTYFNTVFAKATSAQYADLAEKYTADADYAPGTVVMFGGTEEVTITTQSHSTQVAGIVSTNPSYLMNAAQTGKYVVAVTCTLSSHRHHCQRRSFGSQ